METPSSMRTVTRSQASATAQKSKQEESLLSISRAKGKPAERSALLDITNDSPIVGLATERTPASSSSTAKSLGRVRGTPGSGEALLRDQVKNLLQKVEKEAAAGEIGSRISSGRPTFPAALGFLESPSQLLAPTPANTPQVPNLAGIREEDVLLSVMVTSVAQQLDHRTPIPVEVLKEDEPLDTIYCQIYRALMFDSPGKPQACDMSSVSSSMTHQESESCCINKSSEDDDNCSIWSVQVNGSTKEDDDEDIQDFKREELYFNGEEEEESFDDLCEGVTKMTMEEGKEGLPKFAGKHTRFIYNSDDEIEGEEDVRENASVSPSVLVLEGLPVPEGKHLRFQDEEEED